MESAINKCATYQEDGYPAGRWRLPTQAEINFISMLTNKCGFVVLFNSGGFYWSAHGATQPGKTTVDTSKRYALARCVYDSWYWDQYDDRLPETWPDNPNRESPRNHFVFGDRLR